MIEQLVFVLEFKVGERDFQRHAIDQVWDYALDLKNFHEPSHRRSIVPVLIATRASFNDFRYVPPAGDDVYTPLRIGAPQLSSLLELYLDVASGPPIDGAAWAVGRYSPTPTIIEAARALYSGHSVVDISRSDAGASNLTLTSSYVSAVVADAQKHGRKAVCFLTGVPGAGKTLVGLDIATQHMDAASALHSVFLSGNGPLVAILREALARDQVQRERVAGRSLSKTAARRQVEAFIQNVHHFRDDCLVDPGAPPEHVAIFDEAQRAWNREQTIAFMTRKKGRPDWRSFRAERVSDWVKLVLDLEVEKAQETLRDLLPRYPIVVTRHLAAAKEWIKTNARGNERFGLVVSSQAQRLKPHAIDVRVPVDPVHWFLGPKDDVRSSYYLEDAATEFHVQGLELDWACVVWDADFRKVDKAWDHWSFVGSRWQRVRKADRQTYLKNAYRVLLTRARQGMALVVPSGSEEDSTRDPSFYDETYDYLRSIGVPSLD